MVHVCDALWGALGVDQPLAPKQGTGVPGKRSGLAAAAQGSCSWWKHFTSFCALFTWWHGSCVKGTLELSLFLTANKDTKARSGGFFCFLFLPPPFPQILKAHDLMLKHIIIVHRPTAPRKALIFNEQFPNDKRAGLIKASNYISCRKKKEKKRKKPSEEGKKYPSPDSSVVFTGIFICKWGF